ncbi:hypothetical protein [Nocardioides acrostichi]|uniref:Uncharacterized protein n=1 Tax=Nocardioides acrostichi TaxID=2784339 RepID=A0A930Y5Y1_9ACTN|nr:hypothetical protein [Nocardioides acrostichi]MBF4160356.1 hypothetical protein [Nocardioides acrostichi]
MTPHSRGRTTPRAVAVVLAGVLGVGLVVGLGGCLREGNSSTVTIVDTTDSPSATPSP